MTRIKNIKGDRVLQSQKGAFVVQAHRGGLLHIQAWPRKRGPHKDPEQKQRVSTFTEVIQHCSRLDPMEHLAHINNSEGSPYTWRDEAVMCAYGRLNTAILEDGTKLTGLRMVDTAVGRMLMQLAPVKGSLAYYNGDVWAVTPPGAAGQVLTFNTSTGLPEWGAGGGGGASASWALDTYYDGSVDGAVDDIVSGSLADKNDVLILMKGLTTSASGKRMVRVSVDGSTFEDSVGDYQEIYASGGVASNDGFFCTTSSSGGARSAQLLLTAVSTTASAINAQIQNRAQACAYIGSAGPIKLVQILNVGSTGGSRKGQLNGGEVWIYTR